MQPRIAIQPHPKSQLLNVWSLDFPKNFIRYMIPEAIGSTDRTVWGSARQTLMAPTWKALDGEGWAYEWKREGLLAFSVKAAATHDQVDVAIRLTNLGDRPWPNSTAFSCLQLRNAIDFSDFEGTRTYLLLEGKWVPITQIKREDSDRPTIQFWYLKGKPRKLGFVEHFRATSTAYPEGVLAVRSFDDRHVVAVSADKPLFLFSNLEFACIHCCPTFGALKPGEEGTATHRVFLCRNTSLDQLQQKLEATWKP